MPSSLQRHEATSADKHEEFVRMQFEQTFTTIRTHLTLLIQAITVLIVASVTILGFAVAQQLASVLLATALFPLAVLFVTYIAFRLAVPLYYTAVSLEREHGDYEVDWLGSTFASFVVSEEYVAGIRAISELDGAAERRARLDALPKPWFGTGRGLSRLALIALAAGQVIMAIVLAVVSDWRFS